MDSCLWLSRNYWIVTLYCILMYMYMHVACVYHCVQVPSSVRYTCGQLRLSCEGRKEWTQTMDRTDQMNDISWKFLTHEGSLLLCTYMPMQYRATTQQANALSMYTVAMHVQTWNSIVSYYMQRNGHWTVKKHFSVISIRKHAPSFLLELIFYGNNRRIIASGHFVIKTGNCCTNELFTCT